MSRLIGIDHGTRRIGVAVGDTETNIAFAREAIVSRRRSDALDGLVALARAESVDRFVVGLPLHADGREGDQAAAARAFALELAERSNLPVELVDERNSTWAAGEQLAAAGRRPARRSGERDATAAAVILQQYLDDLARWGSAGGRPTADPEEPA